MRRRLWIIGLITTFCLSGCSRDIEPMVEDKIDQTEIKLSDEQLEFLAKGVEFVHKYPCITWPVLPSRVISPWLN